LIRSKCIDPELENSIGPHPGLLIMLTTSQVIKEENLSELERAAMLDGERNLAAAMKIAYARSGYKDALKIRPHRERETPKRLGPQTCRKRRGAAIALSHKSGEFGSSMGTCYPIEGESRAIRK
jgi:hypothetical protein